MIPTPISRIFRTTVKKSLTTLTLLTTSAAFASAATLTQVDIGTATGSAAGSSTDTITSSSHDMWGTSDNFTFAYDAAETTTSDFTAMVRVTGSSTATYLSAWAKAALIARDTLAPGSAYAGHSLFGTNTGQQMGRLQTDWTLWITDY